jgi:hypothetical protein
LRNSSELSGCRSVTGCSGGTTDDRASRISSMRSELTAARGVSVAANVAIITAIRIWMR